MKTSEEIIEISKAMNMFQAELETVHKDSKGYNYRYADYASIWNAIKSPLTKNGLSIIQDAKTEEAGVSVTTRIMHISGQWIEFGPLLVPMGKRDAHSTGSAITYSRRYSLSAALGIVPDDDDGAAAQKTGEPKVKPIPAATKEQYEEFVEAWSSEYDRDQLIDYIKKRSGHFKKTELQTVYILSQDQEGFQREFEAWSKKQS